MSILSNRLKYVLSPQADIYKKVSAKVHSKVADIGCGLGFGTNLLLLNSDEVHGYDIDFLDFAEWSFPKIKFRNHNIVQSPLPEKYDFITMIDVIEHINRDLIAIENAYRSLNDDGTLILSTPNKDCRYRKSDNHIREYTVEELLKLLNKIFNETNISIVDINLNQIKSFYVNPIIAFCKK